MVLLKANSIDISIIIPVYNRENEIADCLEKLSALTFDQSRFEVLIVDDASTDGTITKVRNYKEKFQHLKLICLSENTGGASIPRNTALKEASGKWILFVDSDDYITPTSLLEAFQLTLEDTEVDLVCMPYFKAENGKRAISRSCFSYPEPVVGLDFFETKLCNSLNIVGKLIRKQLLDEYQIFFPKGIRVREDNLFSMKLYSVVRKIAFLGNKKNYYFCKDQDEVSLSLGRTSPRDAVKIFSEVFSFIYNLKILTLERKKDFLAVYLNRYVNMIRRGIYSPERLLENTRQHLFLLIDSSYIEAETKQFIVDLYDGKYKVKDENSK